MTNNQTNNQPTVEKKFRFANQFAMFTYKTHIDKGKYTEWFKKEFNNTAKNLELEIAHENGKEDEECPYEHTHVVVNFKKTVSFTNERRLDYEGIHPHIKYLPYDKGWKDGLHYISKEDPECAHLKNINQSLSNKVWDKNSTLEMLEKCVTKASDVNGLIQLYKYKKREPKEMKIKLRDWQESVVFVIEQEASDRKVNWVYDEKGGCGKSVLCKYLKSMMKDNACILKNIGRVSDVVHVLKNEVEKGWTGKLLMIDISRAYEDRDTIYEIMEGVKDGQLTSLKYDGGNVEFENENLWVFANFLPKVKKMSEDRWNIMEIDKHQRIAYLTLKEVGKKMKEDDFGYMKV